MTVYHYFESPAGLLRLESDGENLTGLYFAADPEFPDAELPVFTSAGNWLSAYFCGEPYEPDFSIHLSGTPFQLQVWEILQTIPFGETRTYGDIAREMAVRSGKQKMSAQAVGQAVGRNPISIIIPCHRVIGRGNRLTGYAGGLDKKLWLLHHEGHTEIR